MLDDISNDFNIKDLPNLINIELVDKCMRQLKLNKASGHDNLSAEHLIYAHPLLCVHKCALYHAIVASSYVPDEFGRGRIILLLKDKIGDINSLDNFKGITHPCCF